MNFVTFIQILWLNFEASKSDRNLKKIVFCGEQWLSGWSIWGHQTVSKILGDAGKFRLVINESKFTSGMNQKMSTHQKQSQVEATYEKLWPCQHFSLDMAF
jgi:hypothetical protein